MKKYRVLVFLFLFITIVLPIYFIFIVWYIDPFALWHKPFYCPNQVYKHKNMRYNARRFIEHSDYDSLIFGSSMLVNTSAQESSKVLGGKFINISIEGSRFAERRLILDYIFERNKKINTVITTFDSEFVSTLHNFSYLTIKQ